MDVSSSDTGPPEQFVSSEEIRRIFAQSRYFQRCQAGEFRSDVRDLGPALRREGEILPRGAREQMVRYVREDGRTMAFVHQRAGDSFGNPAPGTWADPKYVYYKGTRYKFSPKR